MPLPSSGPSEPTRPLLAGGLSRRHLLVGGAAAGGVLALGGLPSLAQQAGFGAAPTDPLTQSDEGFELDDTRPPSAQSRSFGTLLTESPDRGIMFPIFPNSATSWTRNQDTYGACRSGCSRLHQGEDLMAPKMTKMVAVVAGTVVEMRHGSGGNSLYIQGDDGWFYCYLHINNDTPRHRRRAQPGRVRPGARASRRTPSNPDRGPRPPGQPGRARRLLRRQRQRRGQRRPPPLRDPQAGHGIVLQRDPAAVVVAVGQPAGVAPQRAAGPHRPRGPARDLRAVDHLRRPDPPPVRGLPRPGPLDLRARLLDRAARLRRPHAAVVHQLHPHLGRVRRPHPRGGSPLPGVLPPQPRRGRA